MFSLAILIGIYSYIILSLGFLGILYPNYIFFTSSVFFVVILFSKKEAFFNKPIFKIKTSFYNKKLFILFISLFLLQALVNLIGVFGPELAFDALWYHLTLPKIFLQNHSISYIPGGLLYYSVMPKLMEMLYIPSLALNGEVMAKFIHFIFGILSSLAIYHLSRKFLDQKGAILAVLIFYSNLVVNWQSITAYVDLGRTFFEVMALWGFLNWWKKGERKWLLESAVMMGLAISVKLLSIGSLFIFSGLLLYKTLKESGSYIDLFKNTLIYWIISFLIASPWFVFSFINTGNPFHPIFSSSIKVPYPWESLTVLTFIGDMWIMFTGLSDPISPIYVIFIPLAVILLKQFKDEKKVLILYLILAIVVWYLTPRTGGGRFILPYLPAFSIATAIVIEGFKNSQLQKIFISVIILLSLFSISYRFMANTKYLPVILGQESKDIFLTNNLNFNYGDFYDTDNYFRDNIKKNNKVLLYGFHNLYYVNFPFIDSSWVKIGDRFNYIAVQNSDLPERFKFFELVYQNKKTNVKVYSLGGKEWIY